MRPRQFIGRILVPGLVLWAILWACNTPSIPMPPPGPDSFLFEQNQDGLWTLTIKPNVYIPANAEVTVKNLENGLFVGGPAESNGSFLSQPFFGNIGDVIQIWFITPQEEGGVTCLILDTNDPPTEDPRCGS
ncbi:MAG: hypothetical protein ABI333_23785 [bacterium]